MNWEEQQRNKVFGSNGLGAGCYFSAGMDNGTGKGWPEDKHECNVSEAHGQGTEWQNSPLYKRGYNTYGESYHDGAGHG